MIIFLYGQDTYRSRQKLNEIIDHYKKIHKSGLNLKFFDFKNDIYEDFRNESQSASMFTEKKLIILKNAFFNEDFKINFLKEAKKFLNSKDIILFYEGGETLKKDRFSQFLKKNSKLQEFQPLEGEKLKNWAKKEFEKWETKVSSQALEKLINFVGNNLWQFSNEIQKLVSYQNSGKIEAKDIELLVRPKIELDIFKTIDAIASKNKKEALSFIHQHLERGDSPLYLLSMIGFQFRNLLTIKSSQSGYEKFGMHPYIVKKTMIQARKFSFEELKKIYQKIFQADLNIKTGKIEPQTALDLLITEI